MNCCRKESRSFNPNLVYKMSAHCLSGNGFPASRRCFVGVCLWSWSMLAMAEPLGVAALEGLAEYRSDASPTWRSLEADSSLELPVEIRTTSGASVVLQQAGSRFTLKPETRLSFSGEHSGGDGLISRIKQWIGTAFYNIERQPDALSVETPFLVSTIKGTQFVIVTTEKESFVTLTEGSLQVLDLATGEQFMIQPGEITGSSSGQVSARTYQPSASTPAAATPEPERVIDDTGVLGLSDRGKGFERAVQGIQEIRTEQRVTAERRADTPDGPEKPGSGGQPEGPGSGSGQNRDDRQEDPMPGLVPKPGNGDMPGSGDDDDDDDDDGDD
ncbi:MAG: hypothetical protein CME36_04400 [unclassified Hahellaceae]|nr:hypothetical protein [Hahellaceae bacterium]